MLAGIVSLVLLFSEGSSAPGLGPGGGGGGGGGAPPSDVAGAGGGGGGGGGGDIVGGGGGGGGGGAEGDGKLCWGGTGDAVLLATEALPPAAFGSSVVDSEGLSKSRLSDSPMVGKSGMLLGTEGAIDGPKSAM